VGKGIALLFHDRGTRRGWVVSSTPRPHFTPGEDPVPILQEAGWAPGSVWTGGKISSPPGFDPYCPARSQSLYRLSYRAHNGSKYVHKMHFRPSRKDRLEATYREFDCLSKTVEERIWAAVEFWLYFDICIKLILILLAVLQGNKRFYLRRRFV